MNPTPAGRRGGRWERARADMMASSETSDALQLLGSGMYVPETRCAVVPRAEAHGVDASAYHGWPRFALANDEEHPSDMATSAARAAIADAGVRPDRVGLVLFTGVSRDYLPSWSVATEVMKHLDCPSDCVGFDMTSGCLGSLLALDVAQGWLGTRPGRLAIIVAAERWAATVSYADRSAMGVWAHSDGAGAIVVGVGNDQGSRARYLGAAFTGDARWNGHVRVAHGGTRSPLAPPGDAAGRRIVSDRPRAEVYAHYLAGYEKVISEVTPRSVRGIGHIVCNQASPRMVDRVAAMVGVAPEQVVRSGSDHGHVGSADIAIGLTRLWAKGQPSADVLMAGSTSYGFGAALWAVT